MEIKRQNGENYSSFLKRIVQLTADKKLTYTEMGDYLLGEKNVYSSDNLRKAFYVLQKIVENIETEYEMQTGDELVNLLEEKTKEFEKSRIKMQTEKIELDRWKREMVRSEMLNESVIKAIEALEPFDIPEYINPIHSTRGYCLCFGDEHFSAEFELKDLFGNVINSYSPEIFYKRMQVLLYKTIEIIKKENINELYVFSLGDFQDGLLRVSQLMKLRYGVVDSTIKYSEYISEWLNELTKYVRVKFQMTDGNHTELRMLNQKKGTFSEDNMGKIVREFIKIRLANNPNFTMIENPTGYIYAQVACNTILGIHGETRDMEKTLKDFSSIYNVPIQYLIAGHMHHGKTEDIGYNISVINIPSIVGTDPYALSLNKNSNAAGKLMVFDQIEGLICEHTLKVN